MSMQLGGGGGVKSDINVTPLVDVMLVLLIIMMIIAPLLQKGVDVRLPIAINSASKPETQDQTVVVIKADKDAPYSAIMEAMDTLRASGIEDVGLITDSKAQSALAQGGK